MSRTDVHRPDWVKERDFYLRHLFAEDHDHRHGPCDLETWRRTPQLKTHCRLRYVGRRNIFCGCRLCTGHHGRKYQHRMQRAAWRTDARAILKGAEQPSPRRFEAWF